MYFVIKSNYDIDTIFLLNDEKIETIRKRSLYLSGLIDIMIDNNSTQENNCCVIDLCHNHVQIFYDLFGENDNLSVEFNDDVSDITYLFLRLKMCDELCFDDVQYIKSFKKITINNFFEDFMRYVTKYNDDSNYLYGLSMNDFIFDCLYCISNKDILQKIFSIENIVYFEKHFNIVFNRLCMVNPYITDCKKAFDNYEKVTIDKISTINVSLHDDEYFDNVVKTSKICSAMVINNGLALKYLKNQNSKICSEAVKQNGNALKYVIKQTYELCLEAVKQNGCAIQHVREQTYELCLEAVKQNGCAIQYVREQTYELCLEAVKYNGNSLQYVKNQTEEICIQAVKQDPPSLQYVKNQTQKICIEAVKLNAWVLCYVKTQTRQICLEAVKNYGMIIKYVKIKTHDIYHEAVKQDWRALEYVEGREMFETHLHNSIVKIHDYKTLCFVRNQIKIIKNP